MMAFPGRILWPFGAALLPRQLVYKRRNTYKTVAALLGHASTKVTAKHYSHWVKGRQEKLEEAVKSSWEQLASTL